MYIYIYVLIYQLTIEEVRVALELIISSYHMSGCLCVCLASVSEVLFVLVSHELDTGQEAPHLLPCASN